MITSIGKIPLTVALPMIATSLANVQTLLASEYAALQSDLAAMNADLLGFQNEAAAIAAELASVTGLATDLERRLQQGLSGLQHAIEAAIASIVNGDALRALQATLTGGLQALLLSVQNALLDALAKKDTILARIAALQARITNLIARIAALAGRIAALLAMLQQLSGLVNAMASASMQMFAYQGPIASFGSEVASTVEPDLPGDATTQAYALILATCAGATWSRVSKIFKVAP